MALGASALALGFETLLYGISSGTFTGLDLDAPGPAPIFGNPALDAALTSVLAALVLLAVSWAVFGMAKDAQKRAPGTLSAVVGRLRWRWLTVCMALAAAFSTLLVGVALLAGLSVDASAISDGMDTAEASNGWAQVDRRAGSFHRRGGGVHRRCRSRDRGRRHLPLEECRPLRRHVSLRGHRGVASSPSTHRDRRRRTQPG